MSLNCYRHKYANDQLLISYKNEYFPILKLGMSKHYRQDLCTLQSKIVMLRVPTVERFVFTERVANFLDLP